MTDMPRGRFDLNWEQDYANRRAEEAEYGLYENKLHGVILQLRRRARAARRWGLGLLVLLVVIILFALMPYVLSPVVRDFLDGQKAVLEDSRDAAQSALTALDQRRDALKAELVEGLKQTPVILQGDWPEDTTFHAVHAIDAETLLILGDRGALVRYDVATGETEWLKGDWPENMSFHDVHEAGANTLLILGGRGTLVRYEKAKGETEWLKGDWPESMSIFDVHEAGTNTLLILGDEGTLVRYDKAKGETEWLKGDWPEDTTFYAVHEGGANTLLILGDEGTLVRYDKAKGETEWLKGDWPENTFFRAVHEVDANTLLILGNQGTLVRYDKATGETERLSGDWWGSTEFHDVHAIDAETLLILGSDGTLVSYDVATGTTERLTGDWPEYTSFYDVHAIDAETLLILGNRGTLVRTSNELSDQIARAEIADDADLVQAIDALPGHIQDYPIVISTRPKLTTIIGERAVVQPAFEDAQKNLDDLPTGVFQLNKQRKNFRDFMFDCRNGSLAVNSSGGPDSVTLACTEAWQATLERDRQTWWQIIASQAPPGILLLFLLATLGGLYRYNMRLAGFHSSRADALELSLDHDGDIDLERYAAISESMAADKVDFARAATPAAQAVEIAKSVLNRSR